MKVYTEEEFKKFFKSIRGFLPCDFDYTAVLPEGIEVSIMAFRHSNDKMLLEVNEMHVDEINVPEILAEYQTAKVERFKNKLVGIRNERKNSG